MELVEGKVAVLAASIVVLTEADEVGVRLEGVAERMRSVVVDDSFEVETADSSEEGV